MLWIARPAPRSFPFGPSIFQVYSTWLTAITTVACCACPFYMSIPPLEDICSKPKNRQQKFQMMKMELLPNFMLVNRMFMYSFYAGHVLNREKRRDSKQRGWEYLLTHLDKRIAATGNTIMRLASWTRHSIGCPGRETGRWDLWGDLIRWQRQLLCMKVRFHAEKSLMGESTKMNTNDIVRYSLQLAMLLKL